MSTTWAVTCNIMAIPYCVRRIRFLHWRTGKLMSQVDESFIKNDLHPSARAHSSTIVILDLLKLNSFSRTKPLFSDCAKFVSKTCKPQMGRGCNHKHNAGTALWNYQGQLSTISRPMYSVAYTADKAASHRCWHSAAKKDLWIWGTGDAYCPQECMHVQFIYQFQRRLIPRQPLVLRKLGCFHCFNACIAVGLGILNYSSFGWLL